MQLLWHPSGRRWTMPRDSKICVSECFGTCYWESAKTHQCLLTHCNCQSYRSYTVLHHTTVEMMQAISTQWSTALQFRTLVQGQTQHGSQLQLLTPLGCVVISRQLEKSLFSHKVLRLHMPQNWNIEVKIILLNHSYNNGMIPRSTHFQINSYDEQLILEGKSPHLIYLLQTR